MKEFPSYNNINIAAPGRICLFGDHQDYLGLPVIACAINRRIVLTATENSREIFHIIMPDIASERFIDITESFEKLEPQDYFGSTIRVLRRYGYKPAKGYTITLKSDIPINAGVSSSSALVVAWTHFLLMAFDYDFPITAEFVAQVAYEAEVVEHKAPGGRMDQYTSAIGNIIFIDTAHELEYRTIGNVMEGLILAESGIPKQTLGLLSHLKTNALKAIDIISEKVPDFKLKDITMEDYDVLKAYLSDELQPYFYAAIKNHSITKQALKVFENNILDYSLIGKLMSEHHQVLKEDLKITVPKIDAMIDASLLAGAYGAKIVGSGGGGSIAVLSPLNKVEEIIEALLKSGAKTAYKVSVSKGTQTI